jgi:hypothetical protein
MASMMRAFIVVLAAAAGIALFGMVVYSVLVVAGVSEPAPRTVHGLTLRRAWATASVGLALVGVISGGLGRARSVASERHRWRHGATVAVGAGAFAAVSGALNVTMARGGPGTGNGVVGGAVALTLGLLAVALGAAVLRRNRSADAAGR